MITLSTLWLTVLDNRGPELDCSNAYSIISNLSKARSVRFVLVASQGIFDNRSAKFKDDLYSIVKIFRKADKDLIKEFNYIFTNVTNKNVNDELNSIYNNPNEGQKRDRLFLEFVYSIIQKYNTDKGYKFYCPNLVESNLPSDYLDKTVPPDELISCILQSKALENPSEAFQFNITGDSYDLLKDRIYGYLFALKITSISINTLLLLTS